MTAYLCISLIITALILMLGYPKMALLFGLTVISWAFGYRLIAGEEVRVVVADALFVAALLPIGLWAQKQFEGITAPSSHLIDAKD